MSDTAQTTTPTFDSKRVHALLHDWHWQNLFAELEAHAIESGPALILGWNALENGALESAAKYFETAEKAPEFKTWAETGKAAAALRSKDFETVHQKLDAVNKEGLENSALLGAMVALLKGSAFYHQDKPELALREFERALELVPPAHVLRGRILDALGKHYASQNNFTAAHEFFAESLKRKERSGDTTGVAFTHGSLGRLMLDWGYFKEAREHFLKDLELVRGKDFLAEAQMYNFLGRVDLAEKHDADAAGWLDESVARSVELGAGWLEGFARKDRALAHLSSGELTQSEEQLDRAAALLNFPDGMAHVDRARGMLRRGQKRFAESETLLRQALTYFEGAGEHAEAARTLLEEARTLAARGATQMVRRHALERALSRAELCRRTHLVREAEAEMRASDEHQFVLHAYKRASGKNVAEDAVSLFEGIPETVTIMFMDLKNSTEFVTSHDPRWVLMALNQIFADLEFVLSRHGGTVNQYLGDGFMAYFRGADHARRAVAAALELSRVIEVLNRPRAVLKLPKFEGRMGIATGEVVLGHVGTFKKFDFTAVGAATNLAARLQSESELGVACIARSTQERVAKHFTFRDPKGRTVELKGFGEQTVWDVTGALGTRIIPARSDQNK